MEEDLQFTEASENSGKSAKVQITIKIDADVLNYFKERALEPNSAPYQTQINSELRAVMESGGKGEGKNKKVKIDIDDLLSNKKLIKALAKEVRKAAYL